MAATKKTGMKEVENLKQFPLETEKKIIIANMFLKEEKRASGKTENVDSELKRRTIEMRSGRVRGLTFEEFESKVQGSHKRLNNIQSDFPVLIHPAIVEDFKAIFTERKEKPKSTPMEVLSTIRGKFEGLEKSAKDSKMSPRKLSQMRVEVE